MLMNTMLLVASNTLQFVLALYVLKETGSATMFSAMLSVIIVPRMVVTPFAGIWGDKYNKKKLLSIYLLVYISIYTVFALFLNITFVNKLVVVFVFVITVEIIETLYTSANSSMVPILVNKEDIGVATSYIMIGESISSIFSPVFGAVIMEWLDITKGVILLSLVVLGSLFMFCTVKIETNINMEVKETSNVFMFKETLYLVMENDFLKKIVILAPLINFFFAPLLGITYIYFLNEVLYISSFEYGLFESVAGIALIAGGVVSAIVLRKNKFDSVLRKSLLLIWGTILIQCLTILLISNGKRIYWLMVVTGFFVNIFMSVMNAATSTLFKQKIPIGNMSRITAVINLLATVLLPIGQIMYGVLADKFNILISFMVSLSGISGIYFLCRSLKEDGNEKDGIKNES